MDNKKQKEKVIEYLENTYMGAKMVGDDLHKDIFSEDAVLEFLLKS